MSEQDPNKPRRKPVKGVLIFMSFIHTSNFSKSTVAVESETNNVSTLLKICNREWNSNLKINYFSYLRQVILNETL